MRPFKFSHGALLWLCTYVYALCISWGVKAKRFSVTGQMKHQDIMENNRKAQQVKVSRGPLTVQYVCCDQINWRLCKMESKGVFGDVTSTCSASWSLLWLGEAGQESCSSDEEWASWSLSSIATGATVHSAISNQKGAHMWGDLWGQRKRVGGHVRKKGRRTPRMSTMRKLEVGNSTTRGVNVFRQDRWRQEGKWNKY